MKKIIAFILCLVMLFAFVGCSEDKKEKEEVTVSAGEIVKVPVNITKNPGMVAASLKIKYDTASLEFLGYTNEKIFEECTVHEADGIVNVVSFKSNLNKDDTSKGNMLTLKFKVKNKAKSGTKKFTLSQYQFVNTNEKEVKVTVEIPDVKVK